MVEDAGSVRRREHLSDVRIWRRPLGRKKPQPTRVEARQRSPGHSTTQNYSTDATKVWHGVSALGPAVGAALPALRSRGSYAHGLRHRGRILGQEEALLACLA